MLYFPLSRGELLPMIGLGTYDLRGETGSQSVRDAIEIGYRHIDTAATYENEDAVGAGVRESGINRERLFVTTKVDRAELAGRDLVASCERSLGRLKMDYVDLLLIHWPNRDIPIEETLEACVELVEAGKAKHVGVSNFIRPRLAEALAASGLPLVTNQVEFHPHLNQRGLLRFCEQREVLLTAYSPLGQGSVLTDETLVDLSKQLGRSVAQISLRWLLQKGIAAIPKSSSPARMRENLAATEFELGDEEMARVDAISIRRRVIDWWPGAFDEDPDVFD